jgi:MAP3K TRAFs-binding domain
MLSTACSQPTPQEKRDALLKIQRDLGDLKVVPRSVLIELMSSFRDAEAFEELIALYNAFPDYLKDYVVGKQQFALALNRRNQPGDREKVLRILDELLKNRGADSETLGIKGRIHKDIYKEAAQAKNYSDCCAR